jgi:hypothetical protein
MPTNLLLTRPTNIANYDHFGEALVVGDFNGNGSVDLVVGIPGGHPTAANIHNPGEVGIFYNLFGWNTRTMTTFNSSAVGITSTPGNYFGSILSVGDFNGDGKDDLATGLRYAAVNSAEFAGSVGILYGSSNGLTTTGRQLWHDEVLGVPGESDRDDYFGSALVSGDFNGDRKDDLAIGVTGDNAGLISGAGSVRTLYGSSNGLITTNAQVWQQGSNNIKGQAEEEDWFGAELAAGDFNGDSRDDLAVGNLSDVINGKDFAGSVNVLYGSKTGLTNKNNQLWHQDSSSSMLGEVESSDYFGSALAAGDFNNDGKDDLAVGVPYDDIGGISGAGAVNVLYGSKNGLSSKNNQLFHQGSPGMDASPEESDAFGASLAVGDFNKDGYDDLVVGAYRDNVNSLDSAGKIYVLYGSKSGLTTQKSQTFHQDTPGVAGVAQAYDYFGMGLTTADFNRDGYTDLAVGAPGATVVVPSSSGPFQFNRAYSFAGEVNIFFGSANGLTV